MKRINYNFWTICLLFFSVLILNAQVQIGADINGVLAGDEFGSSIDLSSDGSIIAIGAPKSDVNGIDSGLVKVFQMQTDNWFQLGQDLVGELASDESGTNISLSSDGNIIAIGAPRNDGNGTDSGHVRVYQYQTNSWIQMGSDLDGVSLGDKFGSSISLSSDGNIIAIGAPHNDVNGIDSGEVRIYEYQTDSWVQLGSVLAGESSGDEFGYSVNLSSDGSIVAIGAPLNDGNGLDSGHVKVYQYQTNSWIQLGLEIQGESAGDHFGSVISLSSTGSFIVIGAPLNDGNGTDSGHIREYQNINNTWVQLGSDIDGAMPGDEFGSSISSSSINYIYVIGASKNDVNGADSGYSRVYRDPIIPDWHYNCYPVYDYWGYYLYDDCYWEYYGACNMDNWQHILDIDGDSQGDKFGANTSLSFDGNIVAVGAPFNDYSGVDSGHVRVYDLSMALSSEDFALSQLKVYPNPVKDVLNIKLNNGLNLKQVSLYNMQGQYLFSSKTEKVNVKDLKTGIYLIEIETNKGKIIKKIVVE